MHENSMYLHALKSHFVRHGNYFWVKNLAMSEMN